MHNYYCSLVPKPIPSLSICCTLKNIFWPGDEATIIVSQPTKKKNLFHDHCHNKQVMPYFPNLKLCIVECMVCDPN